MIRAIIFDCFGVLISDALQVLVDRSSRKHPELAQQVHDLIQAGNRGLMTGQDSSTQIAKLLGVTYEEYRRQIDDGELRDEELFEYVRGLRRSYKTAVLSNISAGGFARRFTQQELDELFDVVAVSGEMGVAKPEARAYEVTADRLGVRLDECVFTDDRELYCEGARAVGMQAIQYRNFDQFRTELERLLAHA